MEENASPPAADAARRPPPSVVLRKLQEEDILNALGAGWSDLKRAPVYGLTIGAIYAAGGWIAYFLAKLSGFYYFAYPLLTGFALVAPFMAAVTYEVSRRLEKGEALGWRPVLCSVKASGGRDLGWMCLVTLFAFILWVDFSFFLYLMFYGAHMPAPGRIVQETLSTEKGAVFILVGNITGAIIAFGVFAITVVSFPMLLDRDVDFVTAMISSVRSVKLNPWYLLAWAFTIAAFLAFSILSGLVGLIVALPLLGHASWHVYRKLVEPEA